MKLTSVEGNKVLLQLISEFKETNNREPFINELYKKLGDLLEFSSIEFYNEAKELIAKGILSNSFLTKRKIENKLGSYKVIYKINEIEAPMINYIENELQNIQSIVAKMKYKSLTEHIKSYQIEAGIETGEILKILNVSKCKFLHWYDGSSFPKKDKFTELSNLLGCTNEDIDYYKMNFEKVERIEVLTFIKKYINKNNELPSKEIVKANLNKSSQFVGTYLNKIKAVLPSEVETAIIKFIEEYQDTKKTTPSIRAICSGTGYNSTGTVFEAINRLISKGYLKKVS